MSVESNNRPPKDLFSRIIVRLGMEKELVLVKRHLGFFTALLSVFLFLSFFAFIGLEHVLSESNFGPLLELALSDPGLVLKYWQSFGFAVFESMPGVTSVALFGSIALFLIFIRLAAFSTERLLSIIKSINKNGNR